MKIYYTIIYIQFFMYISLRTWTKSTKLSTKLCWTKKILLKYSISVAVLKELRFVLTVTNIILNTQAIFVILYWIMQINLLIAVVILKFAVISNKYNSHKVMLVPYNNMIFQRSVVMNVENIYQTYYNLQTQI